MTDAERKFALAASLVLFLSVGVNMLAFQDKKRSSGIETSALTPPPLAFERVRADGDGKGAIVPAVARERPVVQPLDTDPPVNFAEIVRGIQRELNARGYESGPPDGVVGLITRAAIMAYQHDYGLPLTAQPSEDLLSRIVLGSSGSPASTSAQSDELLSSDAKSIVLLVKQHLVTLGYDPGPIDGTLTPQTRRAIRAFEIDQKLAESGRVSGPLLSRLIRLQAQAKKVAVPRGATR